MKEARVQDKTLSGVDQGREEGMPELVLGEKKSQGTPRKNGIKKRKDA